MKTKNRGKKNENFKKRPKFCSGLQGIVFIICLMASSPLYAAGLLIADGGFGGVLEIKEHEVQVTVNNGIAVTNVTQVFHNTENRQVEALYTFPVPQKASVANFSMWINGKEMVGEVLEKKRAREIYESYKKVRRDPGLLEQVDYKRFEMRIFPIGPGADQKVQITYYQQLDIDHNRGTYVYPLATVTRNDLDSRTVGKFAFSMEIKSAIPVIQVESTSHENDFVFARHSDFNFLASLEKSKGNLNRDIVVSYDLSRPKTGMDLITSKQDGEDGYFCLTLSVGADLAEIDDGMDYVFLLDVSGSMRDDNKLIISKKALDAFVSELGEKDRFELMTFNVAADAVFGKLEPGNEEMKQNAVKYLGTRRARGGTVLAPAMNVAYKYAEADRTLNVVIISDGMTEQKEREELISMIRKRPRNSRVFCIGVGNEINRPLMRQMAKESGGLAAFISSQDNLERQAKAFRRKLTRPVAADLKIDFSGIRVYDREPAALPNLFHGSPIRIYGRYQGSGDVGISLNANVQGVELKQTAHMTFPDTSLDNPEIERMWAWQKVDSLVAKTEGADRDNIKDEIVRLGEAYSIVTEYTSFLVLENNAEYKRWKIKRKNALRIDRDRKAQARLRKKLNAIRKKAAEDIGPQAKKKKPARTSQDIFIAKKTNSPNKVITQKPAPSRSRQNSWDLNIGGGSGPVGPLFVGVALWVKRRRMKIKNKDSKTTG
ncbi:VIT domain-containing protein [Desulfobacterales bacterium HSG16]|nr:VIT domain-containing protein [Desulfobacterales bacterium HSG16]